MQIQVGEPIAYAVGDRAALRGPMFFVGVAANRAAAQSHG